MDQIIDSALDIMVPVMEMAVYSAGRYAHACNRNTVTSTDMEYGMKYAAMNYVGKQIGSYFNFGDESDDESDEYASDEDEFTRYTGDDELIQDMNRSYDEWESWAPENPAEIMLKNAIDAQDKSLLAR